MRNPGLTHIAHENIRNVPCGPLPLRFSGICPDAFAQGKPTAHQFAFAPDAQSGLNLHFTSAELKGLFSWGVFENFFFRHLRTGHCMKQMPTS